MEKGIELVLPNEPSVCSVPTVGEAILDLSTYEVGYEPIYSPIPYTEQSDISDYAHSMRQGSASVKPYNNQNNRQSNETL